VLVVTGIMLLISRQIQQDTREMRERQQNQVVNAFLEDMQDPCGGGLGGSGQPLPGYEEICAPLERADLELPVDELAAGPDLAAAYLTSLQRLLTNTNPPSDSDIAVVNEGGIYASGIRSLAEESRRSCPLGPPPISLFPHDIAASHDPSATTVRGTVAEAVPGCAFGQDAAPELVVDLVEVDMRFARASAGGREMWRLTALRACPVPDDVDLPSELSVLGRPRFSPLESVFLFVSDFCASASESAQVE